jgi:hypothetical protein
MITNNSSKLLLQRAKLMIAVFNLYKYFISCILIHGILYCNTGSLFSQADRNKYLLNDSFVKITPVIEEFAIWGDYDNDGDLDFISNWDALYKNIGDSIYTFEKRITELGLGSGSKAWGDYDNDGDLDLLITGIDWQYEANENSEIYKNNGNGSFTKQTHINLKGISEKPVAWGDYNNDGNLDILLGDVVYKNNGNNTFTSLPFIQKKDKVYAKWMDYNNDGYLDIASGSFKYSENNVVFNIYKNDGKGSFIEQFIDSLKGGYFNSFDIGDYNNDGFTDIISVLFCNKCDSSKRSCIKVYTNNGNETFTVKEIIPDFLGWDSQIIWYDFNNDSYLDFVLCYSLKDDIKCLFFKNHLDSTFTKYSELLIPDVGINSLHKMDYNNDNDLDLLISGGDPNWPVAASKTVLFKNNFDINTPPSAPNNLLSKVNFNKVLLTWNKSTDDFTHQNNLSYNIKIGSVHGGNDILSSMSLNTNGKRLIESTGNTGINNSHIVDCLKPGKYFWSVQAIDNSYVGSPWAAEDSFEILLSQASNITTHNLSGTSVTIKWTNGNLNKRAVFIGKDVRNMPLPADSNSFSADNIFGRGSQIDSTGWYCVYNDTGNSVIVKGLQENVRYTIAVVEVLESNGNLIYNTSSSYNNPVYITTNQIYEYQGISFNNIGQSLWGDLNNDGLLDVLNLSPGELLFPPQDNSFTYINNNKNFFTEFPFSGGEITYASMNDFNNDGSLDIMATHHYRTQQFLYIFSSKGSGGYNVNFDSPNYSDFITGDFDNDGDIDLLPTRSYCSNIFENNGNNTFTKVAIKDYLTNDYDGRILWGDFNNDGYLDIVSTISIKKAGLFINNGNKTFTEVMDFMIENDYFQSLTAADIDNDGYLDIFTINYLYKNNGNSSFTRHSTGIKINNRCTTWGDYDNDGFLDVFTSDSLYKNNGNYTFTKVMNIPAESLGDFDNDGDLDVVGKGKIYKNVLNNGNTKPTTPNTYPAELENGTCIIKWDRSFDSETPSKGLSYNIRIGTTSQGINVIPPISDIYTGFRRIPGLGNCQLDTFAIIKKLLPGQTYYYSVQAVDHIYTGGEWSTERTFTVPNLPGKPILVYPANGDVKLKTNLKINWAASVNAIAYNLQVSVSDDFSTLIVDQKSIKDTVFNLSGLDENTKYYWRVRAANGGGTSEWSDIWNFTTSFVSGMETKNIEETLVFPNPAEKEVRIYQKSGIKSKISIYSMEGKMVLETNIYSKENQLNIENFKPGVYYISISNSTGKEILKFVKH